MMELLSEAGAELLPAAVQGVAALALTLVGMAVELNAVSTLTSGDLLFGGWLVYVGGVALYAGVVVLGPEALDKLSDGNADAA